MLSSERLFLRELSDSDFDQVHSYASDSEVTRYMEWGPNSEEETRNFLKRARSAAEESPRQIYELAIVEIETGHLVGGIGLHTSGSQAMLGYCFARSAWGKGYATEAARLLVGFGFNSLGLHRIWARCDSENAGSLRVLAKLGMRSEGLAKHDCRIRGVWRDTYLFAILEDEWNNRRRTFKCGTFVIWPPAEVRTVVNHLREQYDPASRSICEAHITLTQPFLHRPDEKDWRRLEAIVSGFEPFSIRYGPLNTFLPYPCIYFEIHPPEKLSDIRRALQKTGMFNQNLPHANDFVPHMSITDGSPDIELTREIYENLRKTVPEGSFECKEITFIEPDSDFHFGVTRTLSLGR